MFVSGFGLKLQEGEYEMIPRLGESGWTQTLNSPEDFVVREVRVGEFVPSQYKNRLDFWYEPADQRPRIEGFDSGRFLPTEPRAENEPYTRVSKSQAWITMLPPERATTVTLCVSRASLENVPVRLSLYVARNNKQPNVFAQEPALNTTLSDQPQEVAIAVPAGTGPLTLGWRAQDNTQLVRVYWVGASLSRATRP